MKILQNFLVANLFALVPLWYVAFGWMPDQVKLEVKGNASVALVADGIVLRGENYGTWKEGTVWRFYLREGIEWKNLAFRLPAGLNGGDVGWVWVEKWKLFSLGKSGKGLERKDGEKKDFTFKYPRFERVGFAQGKIPLGVVGIEVFLLGLSWWFVKRHRVERWKTLCPSVMGVAFALALLMQVVLPLQSYIGNRAAFPFMPNELAISIFWHFIVAFMLSSVTLSFLARGFGRWVLAPVLAFTICAFLESGVMSIGLPSLNGNWDFFANTKRSVWDASIWMLVFAVVCGLNGVLKKHYGVASICIAGVVVASLFDVRPEPKPDTSQWIVDEFVPKGAVAQSVLYSRGRNVLVFVIDSMESAQAHAIMENTEDGPLLKTQFRGFTEYTNNIGTGDYSLVAVANLLTGKYPESVAGIMDYYDSIFSPASVLKDYLDTGNAVFFLGHRCFTNRREKVFDTEKAVPIMKRSLRDGLGWTLPAMMRFRWIPFSIKQRYLRLSALFLSLGINLGQECRMYPLLENGRVEVTECGTFLFVHTSGVHVPVFYNRNWERMPEANDSDAGCVEMGIGIFRALGKLFDVYRDKEIYDKSLILVLADHGHHEILGGRGQKPESTQDSVLPHAARPFLWVKPKGSNIDFSTSSMPTSHAKIAELLRESSRRDLLPDEIETILKTENRLFRRLFLLENKKQDWWVQPNGTTTSSVSSLADVRNAEMQPLDNGHRYLFKANDLKSALGNILFENLEYRQLPEWQPAHPNMKMRFRVLDKACQYNVTLHLKVWHYAKDLDFADETFCRFSQSGYPEKVWNVRCKAAPNDWQDVVLDGLVPDKHGQIEIVGERGNNFEYFVEFSYLQVDACQDRR